jgi:poly-gamma-glutamate synthesis protein (capsule biosynthesis protein)
VHFEGFLEGRLRQDPAGLLDPISDVLSAADVAVVNLETNVTERGTPDPKEYTFRAPESAFVALSEAGVDVVSIANNHGRDFGEVGLVDTLDAADRHGVKVIGGGHDTDEAYGAQHIEVAGRRIAILGATQVLDSYAYDRWVSGAETAGLASVKPPYGGRFLDEVAVEAERSDTVVVFLHWGREKETCPTGDQQNLARQLVDAGADIVVGGHAHRVQGGGFLDDAIIHYGLGNFVFYADSGPGTDSGVFEVTVDVDDSLSYRWVPAQLRHGVATPLEGDTAVNHLIRWENLRGCTGLAP